MSIVGEILDIIPVSEYKNRVYTQNVLIDINRDEKLEIDDSAKKISDKMIGDQKELHLRAYSVQDIRQNKEKILDLVPHGENQGPYADIYGKIEKISTDADHCNILIDTHIGRIPVETADKGDIEVGDYVYIKGARLELVSVESVTP